MTDASNPEPCSDPCNLSPGTAFDRYEIVRRLDSDGLKSVYVARDGSSELRVVLKVYRFGDRDDRSVRDQFLARGRAVAQVRHPSLCPIHEVGERDGVGYVVMTLTDGRALSDLLRERASLPPARVAAIIAKLARALATAHEQGVVLTGLRTAHVLMRDGPEGPTVVDYGLTSPRDPRALREQFGPDSADPSRVAYLAPEQVLGDFRAIGPACDIYHLGVILYELLTGRLPFDGPADRMQVEIVTGVPPAPSAVRADLDRDLEAICLRAMARRPEDRHGSMVELADELERWLRRHASAEASPAHRARSIDLGGGLPRGPAAADERSIALDEDVQFTVYRPRAVQPEVWYDLLAFAHLSKRRDDAPPGEPDPVEEVERRAERLLAGQASAYQPITQDSRQAVPRAGEITFLPEIADVEFNPPRRVFRWQESVHSEPFRFRASAALDGQTARGRLTVFLGSIILAEVSLSIKVDRSHAAAPVRPDRSEAEQARPYRKIFASYSHKDLEIVRQFEWYARTVGDEFLRDEITLRTGEVWNDRLMRMIDAADVFQLFWSSHAMRSEYVRQEWEYALALGRPHFIRPTYWEEPLPATEELPPPTLRRLHFQRIMVAAPGRPDPRRVTPGASWPPVPAAVPAQRAEPAAPPFPAPEPASPVSRSAPKRGPGWPMVLVAAFVVFVLGLAGWWLSWFQR
jgi:hypothetical protein